MNIYTTTAFKGYWPVGTAAVIVAHDRDHAASLLEAHLKKHGPRQDEPIDAKDFTLVRAEKPGVIMLCDGDY